MESFERYAGFFPEAALAMMEHQGHRPCARSYPAADEAPPAAWINLQAGAWADAVLPEVVEDHSAPRAEASTPAWRKAAASIAQRLRAAIIRE